ncbi:MAG TPA: cytochrome c maturation protein CcmE [Ktedonobacteraceae bacterium]
MQPALTVSTEKSPAARSRKRLPLSFLLAGIAILGSVLYLVYINTQANAVYYMTVPELKHCTTCATQSVRVAGYVQAGSIKQQDKQTQSISFVIEDSQQTLPVVYSGVVPDIFRAGVQVVVEGHYNDAATAGTQPFQAQTLLAKCPSKFQSASPAAQGQ